MINWSTTRTEHRLIARITDRALVLLDAHEAPAMDRQELRMDITAAHCNGCPLQLKELLAADEFNFLHDVLGIYRHIQRSTGRLRNHFLPRFARKEEARHATA